MQFRKHIAAGNWTDAIAILESVPEDFPSIERLFLADINGTVMADIPALQGGVGKNFAFRDWYIGASRNWEPYISPVYKRAAVPQRNLFAVASTHQK